MEQKPHQQKQLKQKSKSLRSEASDQISFMVDSVKRLEQIAPLRRLKNRLLPQEMLVEGVNDPSGSAPRPRSAPSSGKTSHSHPSALKRVAKKWRWSLTWLAALAIFGGMGTSALVWLVTLPPPVNCENSARLSLDMERLYCAQDAARSGELPKLIAGLDLVKRWTPEHPLYREAQRLMEEWSQQVLVIARKKVERSDLKGAEAAISHIPPSTPTYAQAQEIVAEWRKYSQEAQAIYAKAQEAIKAKKWDDVSEQIVALAEFERDHWELETGAMDLAQQLGVEKQAWQMLTKAQTLANTNDPAQMLVALPIAQEVPDGTYAAAEAKANLKQWSTTLLTLGTQKWQQGDVNGAIAVLQVPATVKATPEVEDLVKFSNAYQLAGNAVANSWVPTLGQLFHLTEAIAAIKQVKPDSPFFANAQTNRQDWQAQLQDLMQIKYASATASLGQHSTYGMAIGQARQIGADRPKRVQAQSLIAFWTAEIERIEDQPVVDRAVKLAADGGVPALQAAIAEASKIDLGRSLRTKAQEMIASWRKQIQILEDQPIIDRSWTLAEEGNLQDAIDLASRIAPGRALYDDAQSAIDEWQYQQMINAQIAEDRPILNRAWSLADSGRYTLAIDAASQISPNRALYGEAQSAIARWRDILNPPLPAPTPSPDITTDPIPPEGASTPETVPTPYPDGISTPIPPDSIPTPPDPYAPSPSPDSSLTSPVIVPTEPITEPGYEPLPPT